ncbi:MAG: hypothetical protein FWE70_05545, partial [Oscillospiraceae bacterium]|nr:hypothetical protein [Oscillospiraceae bacterium]
MGRYVREGTARFHTPGHKGRPIRGAPRGGPYARGHGGRRGFPGYEYDVTELPGTDNLRNPTGPIRASLEYAASAYGSGRAWYGVNGATGCIMAAVYATVGPGSRVLLGKDSHVSVSNALKVAGAVPVYLPAEADPATGVPIGVGQGRYIEALKDDPGIRCVIVTRPNYYGVCRHIGGLCEYAGHKGVTVVCDESHGAHLPFSDRLPAGSIALGADICVHGAHKTLPCLTQGAMMHAVGGKADYGRLDEAMSTFQTTSPSYLIVCSIEGAVRYMVRHGARGYERLHGMLGRLDSALPGMGVRRCNYEGDGEQDFSRVVLDVAGLGIGGAEAERSLRRMGVAVEMADERRVVCIAGVADVRDDFIRLTEGLRHLRRRT